MLLAGLGNFSHLDAQRPGTLFDKSACCYRKYHVSCNLLVSNIAGN